MFSNVSALYASTHPPRSTALAFVGLFGILCPMLSLEEAAGADASDKLRAAELVARLGHDEFAMRERAAADLVGLGLDATAALRAGTNSPNREIRHRSAKLLALISQLDLERRFELFKNATDPEQDYGLPGWNAFRTVAGESPAARAVFVAMHEDEPRLLAQIGDPPKRLSAALASRCDQLRGQAMVERVQVRIGTTAALLLAATREGVEASPLADSVIYMACNGSSFEAAVESGPLREVLAKLAELWINRQSAQGLTFALHVGLTNGLDGCLPRAREAVEAPLATLWDRVYACLCLCRFGDETDFPRLERYLDDVNICVQGQVDGQGVTTQMRDIALACLVRLAKQEPKDFGFERLEYDRRMVFNLSTLGFLDEAGRTQAITMWREFRAATGKATP